MKRIAVLLFAVAMVSGVVTAHAQKSGPTNQPPGKLIVDPPVPDLLAKGIVWITWRAENVNIGSMSGIANDAPLPGLEGLYAMPTGGGCGSAVALAGS